MVKAVIFDFWGTIVENGTYSPVRQSYSILRVRMPFGPFVEKLEQVLMTKPYDDQASAFNAVCEEFNVEPKPIVIEKLIGVWNKNRLLAKLYPDTIDVLNALKEKGLKLILVCNAPNNSIEPLLERFGMKDLFEGVFVSHVTGQLKTTGLFETALKEMKLKAGDVIAVGDSIPSDIKGAEQAGITAYLIDRKERREHERKIIQLSELLEVV